MWAEAQVSETSLRRLGSDCLHCVATIAELRVGMKGVERAFCRNFLEIDHLSLFVYFTPSARRTLLA